MIQIKLKYLGTIREKLKKKEEVFCITEGSSLKDLIDSLASNRHVGFTDFLYDSRNRLDPTYLVTVNGILKNPIKEADTRLKNGDNVSFMTFISGG